MDEEKKTEEVKPEVQQKELTDLEKQIAENRAKSLARKKMREDATSSVALALAWQNVQEELTFQYQQKGKKDLPLKTKELTLEGDTLALARKARQQNDSGSPTWFTILLEEVGEVVEAATPEQTLQELAQVAVAALAAMENIRRNQSLHRIEPKPIEAKLS